MKTLLLSVILIPIITLSISDNASGTDDMDGTALLPDCPDTSNCVSSLAVDPARHVDPFPVLGNGLRSMDTLVSIINSMPRADVRSSTGERLEAEYRSILGFVDDVLFVVSPDKEVIHVRSASRTGAWDMGVNRRRVESIRKQYLDIRK